MSPVVVVHLIISTQCEIEIVLVLAGGVGGLMESRRSLLTGPPCHSLQAVDGHTLEGPPHQWVLLQHLVEAVHAQRVQAAVGVGPDTRRPPAPCQQAYLWSGERGERGDHFHLILLNT